MLVTGTGAVALFSVLFAKAVGADVVATTSQESKAVRVRALGASDTLNYKTQPNWGELGAELTGGFNRVVNAAGGSALDQSIAALAPGGEIAFMGLFDQVRTSPNLVSLMMKGAAIRGTSVGSALAYNDMVEFIDAHGIKPPIGRTFPLSDTKAAYQAAASGKLFGKVVIKVAA